MTRAEALRLRTGLYRIFWKGKGGSLYPHSLAAVGQGRDGGMWFAASNWAREGFDVVEDEGSFVDVDELGGEA